MSTVGLVVHEGRPEAVEAAAALRSALAADGVETVTASPSSHVDLVVSIGGDGTFLRAAHVASEAGCPVLGVKVGRLGFLTEVEPQDARSAIADVLAGTATIEERLALTAESDDGAFPPQWGLNEIMVEKRARHRLVRLAVEVDSQYVTTFSADGVIVASPTGSTAYSFSAHGPIVTPQIPCLVLTPIAPHMVFDRSFVLGAHQVVTLEVRGDEPGILSADGRESLEVAVGTRIRIRASSRPARLFRRNEGPGFLARVRDKFGLPGDPTDRAGDRVGDRR
jgi:NAD+ kinase